MSVRANESQAERGRKKEEDREFKRVNTHVTGWRTYRDFNLAREKPYKNITITYQFSLCATAIFQPAHTTGNDVF